MNNIEIKTEEGTFIVGNDPIEKKRFWVEVDHFSCGFTYGSLGSVTLEELIAIGNACLDVAGWWRQ